MQQTRYRNNTGLDVVQNYHAELFSTGFLRSGLCLKNAGGIQYFEYGI